MPTYFLAIEPISFTDSKKNLTLLSSQLDDLTWDALEHDFDVIQAYLDVSISPQPSVGVFCVMPDDKKHARFKTHRTTQRLDLTLRPAPELEGKVHFLKAVIIKGEHKPKGVKIEYLDESTLEPTWKGDGKFEKNLPGEPRQISLVFGMKGKTLPFDYNIYIRDINGTEEGIGCDPQASNEPPQITP